MKKNIVFRFFALVVGIALCFNLTACRKTQKSYSYFISDEVPGTSGGGNSGAASGDKAATTDTKGGKTGDNTGSGNKSENKGGGKGTTVKVAINSGRPTDTAPLFDALAKEYPNIKVNIDYYTSDLANSQEYIAAKSASGTLPDVVFDDIANLPLYVSQGLVYPLDEFVKNDAEFKYIPQSFIDDYTYGGRLYALPHQAYFTACIMNLDALDALNVDLPPLDWNMDQFKQFCINVSKNGYSACERLFYLEYYASGSYSKTAGYCGYNSKTRSFEMTGTLAKSAKLFSELRKIPNVEAFSLRASGEYLKRFGSEDEWGATKLGKTVMLDFEKGTYSKNYVDELCSNFNWTFWPYPQNIKGRMPIHIDHAFMLANTKNPDAAFKVLSFLTYSKHGNLARINAYTDKANGKGKYKLNLDYYTPTTSQPDVVNAYKKLVKGDEVQMYLYNNMGNCFRGEPDKFVPSFGSNWAEVIQPMCNKMEDGTKDPDSTCKDLQTKATNSLKTYWNDFDAKLKKVQAEWDKNHK